MTDALDIFIPYWGDPDYMKLAVESVLAQDDPRWKLTVIDDAYPDPTIEKYMAGITDPRVRFIKKAFNEGITANFRSSVAMATEDLLTVVGSDDVLLPNYVGLVLDAHRRFPSAAIIQPGVRVIDDNGATVRPLVDRVKQRLLMPKTDTPIELNGEKLAESLLHGDWLYWPSLAFRTDRIRTVDFRDEFRIIQDLALIMDLVIGGDSLLLVPTEAFCYRRHAESASSSLILNGERFAGEREYFALAGNLTRDRGWPKAVRAARLRITSRAHALSLVPQLLLGKHRKSARHLIRHGLGR